MSDPTVKVIIPFRDRGLDLRRGANLEVVTGWWYTHGFDPCVVSDGLEGDAQFNRHRAYNRAVAAHPDIDVFVFTEADMLIPPAQIMTGLRLATRRPGLVVPFTQYRYLSDWMTGDIRNKYHEAPPEEVALWWSLPHTDPRSVFGIIAQSVMGDGKSIGAVNIVSRNTLDITGGFTEATSGNWYDDNIINEGFAFLTGRKTAYVPGPATHLYHLPGFKGDHLTEEDKRATAHNKVWLEWMRTQIANGERDAVQRFMKERKEA